MYGGFLEVLTLFQAIIYFLPYFRPDVKFELIPSFRSDPLLVLWARVNVREGLRVYFLQRFSQETMIKASSSKDPNESECTERALFQTRKDQSLHSVSGQTSFKTMPFGEHAHTSSLFKMIPPPGITDCFVSLDELAGSTF